MATEQIQGEAREHFRAGSRMLGVLARFANKAENGSHFTRNHTDEELRLLEDSGFVAIDRPIHQPTGIAWSEEYWDAEVTDEGREWIEDHYSPDDYEDDGVTPIGE